MIQLRNQLPIATKGKPPMNYGSEYSLIAYSTGNPSKILPIPLCELSPPTAPGATMQSPFCETEAA